MSAIEGERFSFYRTVIVPINANFKRWYYLRCVHNNKNNKECIINSRTIYDKPALTISRSIEQRMYILYNNVHENSTERNKEIVANKQKMSETRSEQ